MPILDLAALTVQVPRPARLLGLDLGTTTIGLAISDADWMVASPLETIRRRKFTQDAEALFAVIDRREVGGLVLGLPLNMDGSAGPRVQSSRAFAANLLKRRDIALAFWDERLSTAAVTRTLIEADASRARRADLVDKMAAAWFLQGALDRLRDAGRFPGP